MPIGVGTSNNEMLLKDLIDPCHRRSLSPECVEVLTEKGRFASEICIHRTRALGLVIALQQKGLQM